VVTGRGSRDPRSSVPKIRWVISLCRCVRPHARARKRAAGSGAIYFRHELDGERCRLGQDMKKGPGMEMKQRTAFQFRTSLLCGASSTMVPIVYCLCFIVGLNE
jgi:hypothetical protein